MNKQEQQIIRILLNEMAFEGALKHFRETPPAIPRELFDKIRAIGIPSKYDGTKERYVSVEFVYDEAMSVFENCYKCLRVLRNNIIHANKAFRPDAPERLADLLAWAERFIDSVYDTESPFATRAREVKAVLKIENF